MEVKYKICQARASRDPNSTPWGDFEKLVQYIYTTRYVD